ncbi:MAG: acyl-CoA/acyl-ACP dehydrogenase [Lentisphaerae bacterium]|nr:acyl-CoA/acyl-ACP dehydrogenase [Lentisphaerota bacterium]
MTKPETQASLQTLPGDDVRQIMWRYADRFDIQMVVQSSRSVARGIVAQLVAEGARNTHDWTEAKNRMFPAFDQSGITAAGLDPEYGGFLTGPRNLALSLVAFELAWVDAGAATTSLVNNLALGPIVERGTTEQKARYMSACIPPQPGETRQPWRGAFALTEPIPYVGVDTGVLGGKVRVAKWTEGAEPMLQVEKRGRFITNMAVANFVTAAVESDDPRLKGTCMVILEESDPGIFDRGAPTHKLVHQLSSTHDPIFNLTVPASRIIGGYTVQNGVIVPNYSHGDIIEAVFARTRVTVGLMTSAKLLSAVEPVVRYQRGRFRGGAGLAPGSPRYDLGLQQKEDALHRLVDIWASGEAGSSLGFETARLFDAWEPYVRRKEALFAEQGITGARAQMRALRQPRAEALEYLALLGQPPAQRNEVRFAELDANPLVHYVVQESLANVLCPACKLWNTGHGTNMLREAVSLMGGYGITEDCPGFLGQKWMDAQLEATYEGPESVQRRQLSVTMTDDLFLAQYRQWITDMRHIGALRPATGACALATAMELWLWTFMHLRDAKDADGKALYQSQRHGVTFPLADALCWLLATRCQILDVLELAAKGPASPNLAGGGLEGFVNFFTDLCHVHTARAAGEVGRICAELVYGYDRHPAWECDLRGNCTTAILADALDQAMPGYSMIAEALSREFTDQPLPPDKAGPCVCMRATEAFSRRRTKLDGCLTGARLAKDRAAQALTQVMIPEALDYPA